MVISTLSAIRTKVRRLTGRPSTTQITDEQIDEYVNTFYIYDLPETLRLFTLHTTYEFITTSNVDRYDLTVEEVNQSGIIKPVVDTFYNLSPPGYIAGYQSFWSQDREQFFKIYPELAEISTTIRGNGTPGPYNFKLSNSPVLQEQVTVGAIDNTGDTIKVRDLPQNRTTGNWEIINIGTPVIGSFDYITATGTITFSNSIPSQQEITVTAVPYQANRPQAILYYSNVLTLRPVPDKEYLVEMNAYRTPTEFISSSQNPEIMQWWQYLAYGAAKKIFEDSQDPNGVSQIMKAYNEQERLVLRRSIVQQTNESTATIYTEMTNFPYGNFQGRF